MQVTDEQVAWLRTYLAGETEVAQRRYGQLTGTENAAGLGALVYAAFVIAARRKFAPNGVRADLINFIAQTRQLLGVRSDVFDPLVAENQLRRALGEQIPEGPDVKSNARAQLVLRNSAGCRTGWNHPSPAGRAHCSLVTTPEAATVCRSPSTTADLAFLRLVSADDVVSLRGLSPCQNPRAATAHTGRDRVLADAFRLSLG